MGKLSATSYVVLGLVSQRPTTGYDLAAFAERSIGQFFPLTRSHAYSELDRLCRLGLLDVTEVQAERFATKRVHEITEQGREVLDAWLDDAALPPERQRNLFLVRVFFGERMSPARIGELLDSYEWASRAWRDELAELVESLAECPGSTFRRATAMYGVAQMEARLGWIDQVRPLLLGAAADPLLLAASKGGAGVNESNARIGEVRHAEKGDRHGSRIET
jgi:PadR family transcriptional regulator, regulatory protein AphA